MHFSLQINLNWPPFAVLNIKVNILVDEIVTFQVDQSPYSPTVVHLDTLAALCLGKCT